MKINKQNKNLVRHQVLGDLLLYGIANKFPPLSYFSYKEIEELRSNHVKRRFAINYLIAKGDIENREPGIVQNIRLTKQGEKSFYSEHYKEIGDKQVAEFWKNAINIFLSIVVAAALIALRNNDNYKEELKSIPQLQQQLNNIEGQLDPIKSRISPLHVILASLNK